MKVNSYQEEFNERVFKVLTELKNAVDQINRHYVYGHDSKAVEISSNLSKDLDNLQQWHNLKDEYTKEYQKTLEERRSTWKKNEKV